MSQKFLEIKQTILQGVLKAFEGRLPEGLVGRLADNDVDNNPDADHSFELYIGPASGPRLATTVYPSFASKEWAGRYISIGPVDGDDAESNRYNVMFISKKADEAIVIECNVVAHGASDATIGVFADYLINGSIPTDIKSPIVGHSKTTPETKSLDESFDNFSYIGFVQMLEMLDDGIIVLNAQWGVTAPRFEPEEHMGAHEMPLAILRSHFGGGLIRPGYYCVRSAGTLRFTVDGAGDDSLIVGNLDIETFDVKIVTEEMASMMSHVGPKREVAVVMRINVP